jgi:chromatin remodeling complex protein RSC6
MQVICQADSALEKIAGKSLCTRSGFVKLVWAYIKRNQLQKPGKGQGRWIIPNQEFAEFMGVEGQEINAFTMSKYIEQHLVIKSLSEPKKN